MAKPKLTLVHIDGVDVTSYVSQWVVERVFGEAITSATIVLKDKVSTLGITFDASNAFHTLEIWRGSTTTTDEKIFSGEVESFKKDGINISIKALDEFAKAVRTEVTKSFDKDIDTEAGVISEIFTTLVTTYAGLTADSSSVQNSGTTNISNKFICNNADVFERCETLQNILDWQMYYNPVDDKVYFEPKGTPSSGETLTVGVNIIARPKWTYNKKAMCNKVTIKGIEDVVETTEQFNGDAVEDEFTLQNTPMSVKVYVGGTLQTGGNEQTSGSFDYQVDVENKKIVFEAGSIPGVGVNNVEVRYLYGVPRPVLASNSISISTYGVHQKTYFKSELKDVSDVEEFAKRYVAKYSTPFVSADLACINVSGLYPGQTIQVIDQKNDIDQELLINKIAMTYPYRFDVITVGDKKMLVSPWGVTTMDRIRRLEEQQAKNQDILLHILDYSKNINFERRYMYLEKKTYDDPETDVFILGSTKYGVLGTNKLGDSTGETYSTVKLAQGDDFYKEYVYDTTFRDTDNDATWDTGNKEITFTADERAITSDIYLGASGDEVKRVQFTWIEDAAAGHLTGFVNANASNDHFNTAVTTGTMTTEDGRKCINFAAGENSTLAMNSSLNPILGDLSYAGWFKNGSTGRNILISAYAGSNYSQITVSGGRLKFTVANDTPTVVNSTETGLTDNVWHSFVAVRNTTTNKLLVSVDGGTFTETTGVVHGAHGGGSTFWIGKYVGGSALDGVDYISDLNVWVGTALTQADATNFHSGIMPSTNPTSRWRFNEDVGASYNFDTAWWQQVTSDTLTTLENDGFKLRCLLHAKDTTKATTTFDTNNNYDEPAMKCKYYFT